MSEDFKPDSHSTDVSVQRAARRARARAKADSFIARQGGVPRGQLIEQLRIHQIELEIQNEDLRESQHRVEEISRQYAALYNSAPVGYLSIDDQGFVRRINETLCGMLGLHAEQVLRRSLVELLVEEDRGLLIGRLKAFTHKPENKHIDVRFKKRVDFTREDVFVGRIQGRRLVDVGEIGQVVQGGGETLLLVISDVSELKESEAQIQHQAVHDGLTGLPNRSYVYDRLEAWFALANRHQRFGALLYLDMDDFKKVNDSLGHQVGDELLVRFAKRLSNVLRREDMLARLGGDEFVLLLGGQIKDPQMLLHDANEVASKLIGQLREPFLIQGKQIQQAVCIGISLYPLSEKDNVHELIRRADVAMYRSKAVGRNQISVFEDGMDRDVLANLDLESEMRTALKREEFAVWYQPQVTPDGSVAAMEALLRWQHPERGMLGPGGFIRMAEVTGLIVPIGDWVLEQAMMQIAAWKSAGLWRDGMHVTVNLSVKQLQKPDLPGRINQLLETHGIHPSELTLEITESLLLPQEDATRRLLNSLADLGTPLSVDDFGTGYSSLAHLHRAPVRELKVDASFVAQIGSDLKPGTRPADVTGPGVAITKAIIRMAHELNMMVVAEGVETELQRQVLREFGCDNFQGYLFSRPVPALEMSALLEKGRLPA